MKKAKQRFLAGDGVNVVVCVDDNNGMMFNKRRQSSDALLIRRVSDMADSFKLWMNEYSAKLFTGYDICMADDFMEQAGKADYCFVEDVDIVPYMNRIDKLIVYRWNRRYPSDRQFPALGAEWRLVATEEFEGKSHPVITEEVYER